MRGFRRWKRRRLRRFLNRRRPRLTPRTWIALGTLAIIVAAAALFDHRRDTAGADDLITFANERQRDPLELITAAGRTHRVTFLGDVHPSAEAKQLGALAIEALARGPGLDAVVLEVGSDLQPYIDAYLASDPENTAPLMARPRTVGKQWGTSNAYLEIYHTVWRLNQDLAAEQQIRIIAADLPDWPPTRRLPPAATAALYARRDGHMAELLERSILGRDPGARVLVFMDGYHALKDGGATLSYGGGEPVTLTWLATHLAQRYPGQVYSILVDAPPRPGSYSLSTTQVSSQAYDLFRRRLTERGSFALTVDARFDFLRRPIHEPHAPGLELTLEPREYRLQDVVDGYIYLGAARALDSHR